MNLINSVISGLKARLHLFKSFTSLLLPIITITVVAVVGGMLERETIKKAAYLNSISTSISNGKIYKEQVLEKFFDKYNSPLKANVKTFVKVADKYNIDYQLLPAISCMESTCGKFLIPGSYNPFGWGIYGKNAIHFKNFDEAIETVAAGLSKNYFSKGFNTPEKIAPIYTPPSKGSWLWGVKYFIGQMDKIEYGLSDIT